MSEQARAQRASSELEIVSEAFAKLRQSATQALFSSQASQTEFREGLYRTVQTIDAVESHLKAVIAGGQIEDYVEKLREQTAPKG